MGGDRSQNCNRNQIGLVVLSEHKRFQRKAISITHNKGEILDDKQSGLIKSPLLKFFLEARNVTDLSPPFEISFLTHYSSV